MARNPRPLSPTHGRRPVRLGRGPRETTEDERGTVFLPVTYEGLKGNPVDRISLTPTEARALATDLLIAAQRAEDDVTVNATITRADMAEVRANVAPSERGQGCMSAGPVRIIPVRRSEEGA